jgi:squalene-hopene/tetraprenyl-beta-curcumene cyclase
MKSNANQNTLTWARGLGRALAIYLTLATAAFSQSLPTNSNREALIEKGIHYLQKTGQAADGSFSAKAGPGITALVVTSMLKNGKSIDDPSVARGLKSLEGFVKPDGGIYGSGRLMNYETCIAMLCFSSANKDGRYNTILKRARDFVTGMQHVAAGGDANDPWEGGATYGGKGRPDLSNTSYMIEALKSVDAPSDDPAIQRALLFVSRCQNLKTEFNTTEFADKVNDGGFFYELPLEKIDPSTSDERYTPNGGLRSYGSMTYSGLKSMVYAGLSKEDKRVKAAVEWIGKHYATDSNPGMGSAGLYYYYNVFAAALSASGSDTITDAKSVQHDWRRELIEELAKRQNADGSWSNQDARWFENDKNLSTAFALIALSHCQETPATTSPK